MMDQIKISKSSPENKASPKDQDNNTVVQANKKTTQLECGRYTKMCGMWTLKHEISSPEFYELLTKTELKGITALELNNFYNHINICLNVLNKLQEYIIPAYQSIKGHYEFE